MSKSFFFKNKNADIEISLLTLLEIVLAIGIVFVLIYLSLKLSGFFIGRQDYDSTINNLEALSNRIKDMVKDKKDQLTQTTVYSITNNYILVGFNYDNKEIIRTECTKENIPTSRPKLCQSKSCLCIYQNFGGITDWAGKDFDDRGGVIPIKCKPFDEKIIFLTSNKDQNFMGAETSWKPSKYQFRSFNYLVVYGKCGNPLRSSFGVRQISLEKSKEGDNIFILIGDLTTKSDKTFGGGETGGVGTGG